MQTIRCLFPFVSVLIAASVMAEQPSPTPRGGLGYGDLRLGMTIAEVDPLRRAHRHEPCDPGPRLSWKDAVAFDRRAIVLAQLAGSPHTVFSIDIVIWDFSIEKGYPCQAVADDVTKRLSASYGASDCESDGTGCSWQIKGSGRIETSMLCLARDPSSGFVIVRYTQDEQAPIVLDSGLQISIRPVKAPIATGSEVSVEVLIRNEGSAVARVRADPRGGIELHAEKDDVAMRPSFIVGPIPRQHHELLVDLAPGEERLVVLEVAVKDLGIVDPGKYKLVAQYWDRSSRDSLGEHMSLRRPTMLSEPVEIEVVLRP